MTLRTVSTELANHRKGADARLSMAFCTICMGFAACAVDIEVGVHHDLIRLYPKIHVTDRSRFHSIHLHGIIRR